MTIFMKKTIPTIIAVFIIFLANSYTFAQDNFQYLELKKRIIQFENEINGQIENIEKKLILYENLKTLSQDLRNDTFEKRFETIEKKYKLNIESLELDQQAFKNELKQNNKILYIILALLTLLGSFGFFSIIPKRIKNNVDNKVESYFNDKIQHIKEIVDNQKTYCHKIQLNSVAEFICFALLETKYQ